MNTEQRIKSDKVIHNHLLAAMTAGIVPFGIDLIAVSAIQLDMMKKLFEVFEAPYDEMGSEAFMCSLSSTISAKTGASIIKFIPFVGSAIGGLAMSVMSAASCYALGNLTVHFLENEIPIENGNSDEAKSLFRHFYREFLAKYGGAKNVEHSQ